MFPGTARSGELSSAFNADFRLALLGQFRSPEGKKKYMWWSWTSYACSYVYDHHERGRIWGWAKADEESSASPGNSLPPTGFPYFFCTDEKRFENPRDMFGDSLHPLPVKRGCVSPKHQLASIGVRQQEHGFGCFWRESRVYMGDEGGWGQSMLRGSSLGWAIKTSAFGS